MITSFNIHRINSIRLEKISHGIAGEKDYYARGIVFESIDNEGNKQELVINVFSGNGHNLLIDDAELSEMLKETERKAA